MILAFAIGNAVGPNLISDVDNFNGESHDAEAALDRAGLRPQSEVVFIQSDKLTIEDPAVQGRGPGRDEPPPEGSLRREREVAAARGERGLGGRPRRPRGLRRCRGLGRGERSNRSRARRGGRGAEAPSRTSPSSSSASASANKAVNDTIGDDLASAGDAVAAGHADPAHDHVRDARGGRGAAVDRAERRGRHPRPGEPAQPDPADRQQPVGGHPADRARGGRRLLALLSEARARGARRWAERGGRARGRGGNVGPRRADLRRDGDGRDGRHVHQRRQDVHLVRDGDDPRRRRGGVRLAHRSSGDAQLARGPRREGPCPDTRPQARWGPRVPLLVLGDRRRHAAPGHLAAARRRPARRARDSRSRDEERHERRRRAARATSR